MIPHRHHSGFRAEFKVLLGMGAVLVIPFALTLMTIRVPRPLVSDHAANPTPQGYTWSLSLFLVPVLVLASWVSLRRHKPVQKKSFWTTAVLLAMCGVLLDVFFGLSFFTFPNRAATLGWSFWGYSFTNGWENVIPIEEIGFYSLGIVAVLLVYIWGDEIWFEAYNVEDGTRQGTALKQLVSFHTHSALFGATLLGLGWVYKKLGPHPWHEGFPGYFWFLTGVAVIPSVMCFRVAAPYINWRAFSLAFLFILLISLFWEATIAVPYEWWGYQPRQMLGLFLNGFSGLPVEGTMLWLGVSWATVIVYETLCTLFWIRERENIPALKAKTTA